MARFDANTSIARCPGRPWISKTSCSISRDTSTISDRTLHCKGERLITKANSHPLPISIRTDGNLTAEASITRQSQPDSPKTRAPYGIPGTSANCTSNETSRFLSLEKSHGWLVRSCHSYQLDSASLRRRTSAPPSPVEPFTISICQGQAAVR